MEKNMNLSAGDQSRITSHKDDTRIEERSFSYINLSNKSIHLALAQTFKTVKECLCYAFHLYFSLHCKNFALGLNFALVFLP